MKTQVSVEVEFVGGSVDGLMEPMEMPLDFCWMERTPAIRKGSRWWLGLCKRLGMTRLLMTEVVAVYLLEAHRDTCRYVYVGSCSLVEGKKRLRSYQLASPSSAVDTRTKRSAVKQHGPAPTKSPFPGKFE